MSQLRFREVMGVFVSRANADGIVPMFLHCLVVDDLVLFELQDGAGYPLACFSIVYGCHAAFYCQRSGA